MSDLKPCIVAFTDRINEPWRGAGDIEPMEVRDYRHSIYRDWEPLCRSIIALATPDPRITQLEAANAQLEADRVELVERAASAWRKVQQANAVGDPHGFSFHARELTATLSRIGEDGK